MNPSLAQHHIFEVNVINNLEEEAIFVQIKASSSYACRQSITVNGAVSSTPIPLPLPPVNHSNGAVANRIPLPLPLNGAVANQRYSNQHRSLNTVNTHGNTSHSRITGINEDTQSEAKATISKPTCGINNKEQCVYAGFVRIVPFQSLPFPFVVDNKLNIAYLTVYVQDMVSNNFMCVANQLPINRQNIQITKSAEGEIVIKSICYSQNQIDNLLLSWSIPQYLRNAMKNNGWNDIALWHEINEVDLIEMGFQKGHQLIFFDKLTELLRNKNKTELMSCIKYMLKAWNLPIYLYSRMVGNGWIDPYDWNEITDEHLKKMGFKDGHCIKFKKHIANDDHIILFQKMQSETKERSFIINTETESKTESNSDNNQINQPNNRKNMFTCNGRFGNFFNKSPVPIFTIDPTTITHEQFWYKLEEMNENAKYYLETKNGNNPWQTREEISDTRRRNICELDMDTVYFIRIKAINTQKIMYSQIVQLQTKDEKWKYIHLPKIPDFKYAVSSNNKQITVEFDPQCLEQIRQTKFDERYSLDIGLSKDGGLEKGVNWKNVATIRKDKLVYKYNINERKDQTDWVHVGISARNDLGHRYNQCTSARQFPFNQVIKRINTTKHGNNLQFDESMTVATKIDQDYQYSTFAFGQPITNEMCNRYDMYVKVNKLKSDCFMGYATSLDSVINWNQALGSGTNKNSSVGVLANKGTADFAVYNKDEGDNKLFGNQYQVPPPHSPRSTKKTWDDGSVFVLSFDFLNDDCNIYLNENNGVNHDHNTLDRNRLVKSIKLNQAKSIVPSFSLNNSGDSIEVVKWRLY